MRYFRQRPAADQPVRLGEDDQGRADEDGVLHAIME